LPLLPMARLTRFLASRNPPNSTGNLPLSVFVCTSSFLSFPFPFFDLSPCCSFFRFVSFCVCPIPKFRLLLPSTPVVILFWCSPPRSLFLISLFFSRSPFPTCLLPVLISTPPYCGFPLFFSSPPSSRLFVPAGQHFFPSLPTVVTLYDVTPFLPSSSHP